MITLGILALTLKFRTQLRALAKGLSQKYLLKSKREMTNENEL